MSIIYAFAFSVCSAVKFKDLAISLENSTVSVAAISLTHGCNVIVTRNVKHFERIEGIEVEEY